MGTSQCTISKHFRATDRGAPRQDSFLGLTRGTDNRFRAPHRAFYSTPKVVADYTDLTGLTPAEEFLFNRYLHQGMRILDVGVGCGRTTPFLSSLATGYTGMDLSEPMIDICRSRFPDHKFLVLDASERWQFADALSLDAVVFSYNGIDDLQPDAKRWAFLKECSRTLVPGGVLIFSVHNPLALFPPVKYRVPGINVLRLLAHDALVWSRIFRALLFSRAFWRKAGYYINPYDRLPTHAAVPAKVIQETNSAGFTFLELVGCLYPRSSSKWRTPWNYFAFRRA